jgi:hypothetical protein
MMTPHRYNQVDDDDEGDPAEALTVVFEAEDPLPTLEAIGFLQRWLSEMEDDFVLKAVAEGHTWAQIGKALGRSKQAVWEKHHDPQDTSPDDDSDRYV